MARRPLGIIPGSPDRGMAGPAEDFWISDSEQVNLELVHRYLTVTPIRSRVRAGRRAVPAYLLTGSRPTSCMVALSVA